VPEIVAVAPGRIARVVVDAFQADHHPAEGAEPHGGDEQTVFLEHINFGRADADAKAAVDLRDSVIDESDRKEHQQHENIVGEDRSAAGPRDLTP